MHSAICAPENEHSIGMIIYIYKENIAIPLTEDYISLLQEPAPKEYII